LTSEKDLRKKLKDLNLAEKEIFEQVNMKIIGSFEPIQRLWVRIASFIVLILSFQSSSLHLSTAQAGDILPRMGAVIELDQVTPTDPWEDRSSRVQWVLARLNCEGFRVWLLDAQRPITDCQVIYFDGPTFNKVPTRHRMVQLITHLGLLF